MVEFAKAIIEGVEGIDKDSWVCHASDEIIFEIPQLKDKENKKEYATKLVNDIKNTIESHPKFGEMPIHYEAFYLNSITSTSTKTIGYVKEFIVEENNTPFVFKCVPVDDYAQAYKHYTKQPITLYDRIFESNGSICIKENLFGKKESME
eukprot:CAMPEP_0117422380 /NCGR_PEP_ID=MMETSP0758-20121206/3234_1 /TAXON_ID=63605 /ORGANISM="Percolomonas cosmopolitus, Strain AE-1 (ATCC 50343)" /LENGTH=149 /DNA_ID=CAMNT_0005204971 /DNA_START=502 /DNA_END=948 /DNA_ORIENTATION=+